ncbi:Uncharacterized protein OBRU01_02157 [Operophtera brumata]|uniref:Peptidase S1 domain-containing protein n=1 Tax=Operophtera brumata TaxID=104452 RepID=A0A0L7LF03_OPEBR|nr:Uncharacterized protein OBRU01_02157 [Operophtera brumata]
MEGFIVGGEYAKIVNHAHAAFLHIDCVSREHFSFGSWSCGASIINQKSLLTAAHCLRDCGKQSRIKIHVGSENWQKGQIYDCNRFVIHFNYDPRSSTNDICLVQVQSPLTLSRNSSRVALTRRHMHEETATVSGWGMFDDSGEMSELLKFVTQKVMSRIKCIRALSFHAVGVGTICATAEHNDGHAARGDSGSALVVRGYVQIGIVSYRITNAKHIAIYTDVCYFYDWIVAVAKELNCIT